MKIRAGYLLALVAGYLVGTQSRRPPELGANVATPIQTPSLMVSGSPASGWPDIKVHAIEELPRVAFLTIFWAILAAISMVLILNNVVDPHDAVPAWLEHYLDEKLNIYIPLFEICIYIFLTGFAVIVGNDAFVALSQEEICRFLYSISAFISLLSITLLCFFHHFNLRVVSWIDYAFSALLYIEGVSVGFLLSWFFKYKSSRAIEKKEGKP